MAMGTAKIVTMERNFPITMPHTDTGEVRSSWSIRALCSSDMLRMVRIGTAIISIIRMELSV